MNGRDTKPKPLTWTAVAVGAACAALGLTLFVATSAIALIRGEAQEPTVRTHHANPIDSPDPNCPGVSLSSLPHVRIRIDGPCRSGCGPPTPYLHSCPVVMPPHSQWTLFFKLDDLTSEEADIVRNLVRQGATVEVGAVVVALPALAPDVTGTNGDDSLRGTAKADKINARAGNDWIVGLRGNDTLIGGRGRDVLYGGSGDDRLLIRDGAKDSADCGSGRDTVIADNKDGVRGNCETVLRPFPNVPPGP